MGKKKLLSLLVSVVMIVAMFPAIVSADSTDTPGTFTELQELIDDSVSNNDRVELSKNYVAEEGESSLYIRRNTAVTICLNGYTIDRNLGSATAPSEDGSVIRVEGSARLTVNEYNPGQSGTITGGYATNGGGIYMELGSALQLNDCTITGNRAESKGGAIYFEGGQLDSNIGAFVINGGNITDNTAEYGGGIAIEAGADTVNFQNGPSGGCVISGNTASVAGGGIYVNGRTTIKKININNNVALSHGGGVYLDTYGHFLINGTIYVTDNTVGSAATGATENVYLPSGKVIEITKISTGTIGVSVEGASQTTVTSGYGSRYSGVDPSRFFSSDSSNMELALNEDETEVILKPLGGEEEIVKFAGYSLTLDDGQIGLNVYVDLGPLTDNEQIEAAAEVQFDVPGRGAKTVTYDDVAEHKVSFGSKTYYKFTCFLSPLQMAEEVNVKFIVGPDYIEKTFSVSDYIKDYLDPESEVMKGNNPYEYNLVQALADYGYFLQPWLSGLNGWEIGGEDGYAQMENIFNTGSFADSQQFMDYIMGDLSNCQAVINESYGIKNVSFKLELESTNALIVTFYMDTAVTDKLSATCTYNGKTYKAYKQENGTYVIRISGIKIQDMANAITIKGIAGTEATEENVNVVIKPLGYAYYGINNPNSLEPKINALAALYNYWNFASLYAREQ